MTTKMRGAARPRNGIIARSEGFANEHVGRS
jgi:hypothetical protein